MNKADKLFALGWLMSLIHSLSLEELEQTSAFALAEKFTVELGHEEWMKDLDTQHFLTSIAREIRSSRMHYKGVGEPEKISSIYSRLLARLSN